MSEALTLNGTSLDTLALMLSDISGIMTAPARRGENVIVPGRHGSIRLLNKRFDPTEIVLPLWIVGALPDGSIPGGSTEVAEFFARRDELLRLLYADPLVLEYTRPDGHAVQAEVETVDVLDFTRRHTEPLAQVNVAMQIPGAFWQDSDSVFQTVAGTTGVIVPLTEFEGATAPMQNLLITFTGPVNNPTLTHGSKWVRYNGVIETGQQLVLDTQKWKVSTGTGLPWDADLRQIEFGEAATWLELDPATQPFEITFTHTGGGSASCTIAGRRAYLSP